MVMNIIIYMWTEKKIVLVLKCRRKHYGSQRETERPNRVQL
jgi:hypothetical protein